MLELKSFTSPTTGRDIMPERMSFASTGDAPFPVTPERQAQSIAYKNAGYIADLVSKRVPVGTQSGAYTIYTKSEGFTVPNTKVARGSKVRAVEMTGTEGTYRCDGYGLKMFIPNEDIQHQQPGQDVVGEGMDFLTDLLLLDREVRLAALLFASGTFASANKATLSGTDQFSHASCPATSLFTTGLDAIVGGKVNACVMGRASWSKLRSCPDLVKAMTGNNGGAGIISKEWFMSYFELDEFYVGDAWSNSAVEGQTASYGRVWGDYCLLYVSNPNPSMMRRSPLLTMSPQWGQRVAYQRTIAPGDGGILGGVELVVGEYIDEITPAADAGYLMIDCVA